MMAIISMRHVTKKFGIVTALDEIDLQVNEGDVYGFIGPNGAGKSTTIRILLGTLRAQAGEVRLFGLDAWRDAVDIHHRVAYVPGEVNLWPHLTGGEAIDLFLRLRGMRGPESYNVREKFVRRFDLDVRKKCGTYSKGNRQKVALVAAFAADADVYILDEPTSGLDPLMERVFQQCIAEVKQRGKTLLLSSHILSEVERLCGKVSIIRQGKIIESGTMAELRHLTRTSVFVETKRPIDGLEQRAGVYDIRPTDSGMAFQVDTEELGAVIKFISRFDIVDLHSAPPTLEELFMHHYDDTGGETS